jgi:UDP-N-acetylmuramyl pentapeptide phosphotransferase/UDP-N-acetylglucosamine-1-phosphate transferase
MNIGFLIISIFTTFIICLVSIFYFIRFANYINLKNKPKNLSKLISTEKVPTSVGLLLSLIFVFLLIVWKFEYPNYFDAVARFEILIASILILSFISFIDDFKSINPIYRLALQITVVFLSLTTLQTHLIIILPLKLSIILSIYFWVYFINVNNFLDGIDGYEISYVVFSSLTILTVLIYLDIDLLEKYIAIALLTISIPFFLFNKPPAKIYMGDSGSIFFGFILGWLLLRLISLDLWYISVIIAMYPLMDISLTIFFKILKGHKPWERLFDYFFLQGVKNKKLTHTSTLICFNIHNAFSYLLAFVSIFYNPIIAVMLSFINSLVLIAYYNKFKL